MRKRVKKVGKKIIILGEKYSHEYVKSVKSKKGTKGHEEERISSDNKALRHISILCLRELRLKYCSILYLKDL